MNSLRLAILLTLGTSVIADVPAHGDSPREPALHEQVEARAFARESQRTIRLRSGRPEWCLQLEPVHGSFAVDQVALRNMRLLYANPIPLPVGIFKIPTVRATIVRDTDRNGIAEVCACFANADVRRMFQEIGAREEVVVRLAGPLSGLDSWFEAPVTLQIVGDDHGRVLPRTP